MRRFPWRNQNSRHPRDQTVWHFPHYSFSSCQRRLLTLPAAPPPTSTLIVSPPFLWRPPFLTLKGFGEIVYVQSGRVIRTIGCRSMGPDVCTNGPTVHRPICNVQSRKQLFLGWWRHEARREQGPLNKDEEPGDREQPATCQKWPIFPSNESNATLSVSLETLRRPLSLLGSSLGYQDLGTARQNPRMAPRWPPMPQDARYQ